MRRYLQRIEGGEISTDPAQREVVQLLDDLFVALNEEAPQPSLLDRMRQVFGKKDEATPIKGLYIWGGVGRGKTMLMDMFYEALPPNRRLRLHFHRFMRRVHDRLNHWSGVANPLVKVAEEFSAEADVLCFDEFFVTDIGDAMILAEVLSALFDRGVTLVATSNVEPSRLYENGLQRRRFLPAIDLINERTQVYHVVDGVDFRLRALEQAEIYHWPLDDEAHSSLYKSFMSLVPDTPVEGEVLIVEGREIQTLMVADDVVWFDFADLCQGPRSQNDYIELAMVYHAVLLSNVPVLDSKIEDAARRFISLVDEFYDHGVKLIISAEASITEIYQGERLRFEFERTQSRLLEMQSHDYLAQSHRA